jgi:hypothetical protein
VDGAKLKPGLVPGEKRLLLMVAFVGEMIRGFC